VAALDNHPAASGLQSPPGVFRYRITPLGDPDLEDAYADAWDEWHTTGDAEGWDSTVGDGLVPEVRP
jgi:hypothetical protein